MNQARLLGPRRRLLQTTLVALYLLLPFVRYQGESLFRFDIPSLALQFAGRRFELEDMLFLWLAVLAVVFFFVFVTLVLGRVWCGWACPQSIMNDLAETGARALGLRVKSGAIASPLGQRCVLFLFFLGLSIVSGASVVWYFVPPYEYFSRLAAGSLGSWPLAATMATAAAMLTNLTFLRRVFCREFCPYGRFQAALADEHSLRLVALPEDLARCIHCQACIHACPVGIDIRMGDDIQCIDCGRCLDACRTVMARLRQPGIIKYVFDDAAGRWWKLINVRSLIAGVCCILFAISLPITAALRSPLSMKINRQNAPLQKTRQLGQSLNLYEGYLNNRSGTPLVFRLKAVDDHGHELLLSGLPETMRLEPAEKIRILFFVRAPMSDAGSTAIVIAACGLNGDEISRTRIKTQSSGP